MTETERPSVLTGHTNVREAEDFDSVYMQGVPPWDIGRSQPAFAELAERGLVAGRVLDAGCGTGEHTLMAAALGLEATGFDVAATAIAIANTKARDRGLDARFLQRTCYVRSDRRFTSTCWPYMAESQGRFLIRKRNMIRDLRGVATSPGAGRGVRKQ